MVFSPTAIICGPKWTHEEMEAYLLKVYLKRKALSSQSEPTNLPIGDSDARL